MTQKAVQVSIVSAPGRPDLEGKSWLTTENGHTELPQNEVVGIEQEPHELLEFFAFAHLKERLQIISEPFGQLARQIDQAPPSMARDLALSRLAEAKDWAVRAWLK